MPGGFKWNQTEQKQASVRLTAGPVDLDGFIWLDEFIGALLANAVLPAERHPVSDREGFTEGKKKEKEEEKIRNQSTIED